MKKEKKKHIHSTQVYAKNVQQHLWTMHIIHASLSCQWIPRDWVKVLRPTRHKTGHSGDVLPSQSLDLVLKKLNLTQQRKQHKNKIV